MRKKLCFNHALELYFCEFYLKIEDYEASSEKLHVYYQEQANLYRQKKQEDKEQEMLEKARTYNPVDLDIFIALAQSYYKTQSLEKMYQAISEMYPFVYTKGDMARYYCLLGEYYLEKYNPELAEVLFRYSNIFMENGQADIDLKYVKRAVGYRYEMADVKELQKKLIEQQIPIHPKKETLGLLFQVGKRALEEGQIEYAKSLLTFLYEMTGDEEVYSILNGLSKSEMNE